MDLAELVYAVTDGFPRAEVFGLSAQMRRCSVSVPSNLAEGHARGRRADYLRFVLIARGSLAELETQLELAERLGYVGTSSSERTQPIVNELSRLLNGLVRSLSNSAPTPDP